MKDPDFKIQNAAASALGKIKDPRAIEPLIAALSSRNQWVRDAAGFALPKIGAPAVKPLIAALSDPNADARSWLHTVGRAQGRSRGRCPQRGFKGFQLWR